MRIPINKAPVAPRAAPKTVTASRLPVLGDILRPEDNNFALVRLLMALAVLVSHSWWLATGRPSDEPLHIWTHHSLGEHAVQVFFFLSGVVVAQSLLKSKSVLDFTIARGLRIFPALIVCVLVTALVLGPVMSVLGLKTYFSDSGLIAYILKTVSLSTGSAALPGVFPDNPVPNLVNLSLWTLKYEVLCYALLAGFGAMYLAWPKLRTGLTVALAVVVAVVFVGEPKPISTYTALDNIRYFFLFFGMGTLAYLLRDRLVLSWLALPLLFLAFVFAIDTRFAEIASALFLGYGTLLVARLKLPRLRWFTNDQDYSFAVYILHCPVQQALIQFRPGIDPIELTLITMAIVLPLSVFSWTHIERPAMRSRKALVGWLRSLWQREQAPKSIPAPAKSDLLAVRVKAMTHGHGTAVLKSNLREAEVEVMHSAASRVETTASGKGHVEPGAAKQGGIAVPVSDNSASGVASRSTAPPASVSRSAVAEWFSRKRKSEQNPVAAAISDQLAERIRSAARMASTEGDRTASTERAARLSTPTIAHGAALSGSPTDAAEVAGKALTEPKRNRVRTRRMARVHQGAARARSKLIGTSAQATSVPMSRVRKARIADASPTKLWARPGRLADVAQAAGTTRLEQKASFDKAMAVAVATARTSGAPGNEPVQASRSVAGVGLATSQHVTDEKPKAPVRETLAGIMARRNRSIQDRLTKQRPGPIPIA